MYKLLTSRQHLAKLLTYTVMLVAAIGILLTYAGLPTPPRLTLAGKLQLSLLLGFYGALALCIYQLKLERRKLVWLLGQLGVFGLVIVLGIQVVYPNYKTTEDALVFNAEHENAAQIGVSLAQDVHENSQTLDDAKAVIEQEYATEPELKIIAQAALDKAVKNSDADQAQIAADAFPTIPLQQDAWNCTEIGCAYMESDFVWTISKFEQLNGLLLLGLGLFFNLGIVGLELYRQNSLTK